MCSRRLRQHPVEVKQAGSYAIRKREHDHRRYINAIPAATRRLKREANNAACTLCPMG